MDRISELPQEISQRILYFLSQEDAVRTSVLSKLWRNIWCTRPNLDFSDNNFKGKKHEFISLVNNTLQRYRDQKLCIEEFGLYVSLDDSDRKSILLLEKWIRTLKSMGMHPKEVRLQKVYIEDENFRIIIASCPSVETLFVRSCEGLRNIDANNLVHLKEFCFSPYKMPSAEEELCSIEINPPSLKSIEITYGNLRFERGVDFCNLSELHLTRAELSWDNLSSCKFPSLERLIIVGRLRSKEINLFVDAPKIANFAYSGDFIPSISFATTTSRELISVIGLTMHPNGAPSSWLHKLKELLDSLSQSKVSLCISISREYQMNEDIIQENINLIQENCCDKYFVVERLSLSCHLSSYSSLLNGVFSIFRPRKISLFGLNWKTVWKILMQRESGEQGDQCRKFWERDLEEVSMEIIEKNREGWHSINLSELLNHREIGSSIRFTLKWSNGAISSLSFR
ncbi:hypothetical protein MIMGU_mgv1a024133mg [Erythranthe guttata]|uniref:F-box domain-containing protein n=1 Tax=Erythranthe guttata TaxID=4155 RepID=A0A022R5T6_ERYGU|nr:hypothetical protein MIMGU_mgv1a024133mg [Erythranthe guttata]